MDYEKLIHALVDDLIVNKNGILISKLPSENENDICYLICADNDDIARLIGHKGSIAQALREIVSIAGKLNSQRVHLKFESLEKKPEEK